MSVQKVLGLRMHPPCKIVWCLWDGWVIFCFQAKTIFQCKESVHLRFFANVVHGTEHRVSFYVG